MSESDSDFEEVERCGGRVIFKIQDGANGRTCSIAVEHNAAGRKFSLTGMHVLPPHGIPVGTIRSFGIGAQDRPPVPGCIPVFIISDREGFFGRACSVCDKYFRTQSGSPSLVCPYCGIRKETQNFLTEAQRKYIKSYTQLFVDAYDAGKDVTIDMDELGREVAISAHPMYYMEEKQQTRIDCAACKTVSDIMGQYGFCPQCGRRNSLVVINQTLDALADRVSNPRYSAENQRPLRDMEWRNIIRDCVANFEGFGRDLIQCLAKLPATPMRRKAIEKIEFHNPIQAAERVNTLFHIDFLTDLSKEDREFVRKRFLRRHLYEHRSGEVDEEYLTKSGETGVRIGQIMREKSKHAATMIDLVRAMAKRFDEGFHSIS